MKLNKILLRATALVLSILLAITPIFATELSTGSISHFGLPNVFDYDPYNVTFITSVDEFIVVDQVEFLNAVVQGFMSNLAWERYVNFTPYSVQHCEVNYKYYRCITAPRFDFSIDSSFGSYVSINGYSYSTGTQYTFPNSSSDLYFDRSITMQGQQTTANGHSTKIAYAYGIYTSPNVRLMLCDDSDNSINVITDYLNSIRLNVNTIVSNQSTAITFLSNLYTAVSAISSDISTVKSYLNTINSNVSNIADTCSDLLEQTQVNGQVLIDINEYITDHFPIVETDLTTINQSINSFRSEFNTFALTCISHLNSIDTTTQSIDSSLDELLDLTKGTALQDVPVSSGGSTFSLWSIIKNSVSLGLGATGNFFSGLFDLLGIFGQYSNGFSSFSTLSSYVPVSYVPEDLTISTQNLIPNSNNTFYSTDGKFIVTVSGTNVNAKYSGNASSSYYRTLTGVFTLTPGSYLLYAPNVNNISIYMKKGNSIFGSYVSNTNYPFTVNESISIAIVGVFYYNSDPYDQNFQLRLVRTNG